MSACMAKLASTPPVVGFVRRAIYKRPALECLLTAQETFDICIREIIPSCILAPPETQMPRTGSFFMVANSKSLVIFSPTTAPMEPIMKIGSMEKIAHSTPPMVP